MDLVEMQRRPAKKRARNTSPPPDHPANNQEHKENDQAQLVDQADQAQNNKDQADQPHNDQADQPQNDQADQPQNDQADQPQNDATPGFFGSPQAYLNSCALVGCSFPRESDNYCCLGHASLSSTWSAKNKAFHVYDGFHDKKMGREELCCASIILRSFGTDVGIPALVDETVFTTLPWDNQDIFLTNYGRSCDYIFFATPPRIYATIDRARQIRWSKNGRNIRKFHIHDINVTLLTLKTKEKGKFDEEVVQGKFDVGVTKWQMYLYEFSGLSLYCLSMVVQGSSTPTLLPKRPNPKGPKHDEYPDPNGSDGISPRVVNPNEKTGKTKPMTVVSGNVNKTKSIRPTEYCSVLDDFGLEKFIKGFIPPVSIVILSDVCGSTLDSHHGFVAEYGKYRDLDLGFHENDSEVTLDVSMGKQYVGRTRYDKHGNTDAKSEVAVCAPSRSSNYVNITLKNIFEPLYRELYTFDPTFFFTPSFLKEINEDTVESFRSVISESSPGVFVSKMLRPSFCEMMLSKVENFREWVNVTNIQIMSPHTKSKYGIVLEDFGLDSMLMEGFVFPVSKGLPEVCGSTFDSHHGFVVEYGTDRDVDLGFHVNDSETTLSVCLSKQFEGGEGTRCKKLVNTDPKPEEFIRTESEAEA